MAEMELTVKSAALQETIRSLGSLLVAYSGGTDSAYLAYTAHRVLSERMLAVIADSASLPRKELADALAFTAQHGIPTHILQTPELDGRSMRATMHSAASTARTSCLPRWRRRAWSSGLRTWPMG